MPVQHTHIGGQALIEGIMMRGKLNWAVAVRKPDGTIHVEDHDLHSATQKYAWLKWPLIRGVWALYETMALALKAFSISAEYATAVPADSASADAPAEAPGEGSEATDLPASVPASGERGLSGGEIALSMVLGVALAIGLFVLLPAFVTNQLGAVVQKHSILWNVIDGVLRLVVFFIYLWAVGRMEDIRRLFAYHGAEHKTIHAYEHGLPLEASVIQRYETLHVRCGTSFLLMVMVVAIVVFSLVPAQTLLAKIAVRIFMLPLVAGIAYEVTVKWAGSRPDNPLVKVLLWPGMQLQRMTTREPDDSMVEIAVAAMQPIIAREQAAAAASGGPLPATEPALD